MIGFFDIVFECNGRTKCLRERDKDECCYRKTCKVFQKCFLGLLPYEVWKSVSSFDELIKIVNDWREYQNEQNTK